MSSRLRSPLAALGAALSISWSAACGNGTGGTPDAAPDPRCMEGEQHSDLEWIQTNIFSRTCAAFSACHQGSARSAGGLNLEEGQAFDNIVEAPADVAERQGFTMHIVEPGVPEDSYILHILGRYGTTVEENPRIDPKIGFMPYNNEPLCEGKLGAIERWIESL
jgi:hypothetical protein